MTEGVDLVVVGAGLGGLAAAVTAAGWGKRVVVLEQGDKPGGYATGFRRDPYRFDASLHALDGLAPGGGVDIIYHDLGILDRLRLTRLDPLYLARYPGMQVTAHADRFRYETELISLFPDQKAGIRALLDEYEAAQHQARRLAEDQADGGDRSWEELASRYPLLARLDGETAEQAMSRHVSDPRARAVIGSMWGYMTLPPSRLSGLVAAVGTSRYHDYGGWYPQAGSFGLGRALAESLGERGGRIVYDQQVAAIEVVHGRATAVVTAVGLRIEPDAVISNASAPATMLTMVGRDHLPAGYVRRLESPAASHTVFQVFLGLDRDIFASQGLPHVVFVIPSYDHDASHRAALQGDWQNAQITMIDFTQVNPECAPDGYAAVTISAEAAWDYDDTWGTGGDLDGYHANPRYLAIKQRVADTLIARAAEHLPGLAEAIQVRDASTPLTNFTYTANPRGAIAGYENSPENCGRRWLPQTTPIRNLFLAGAWTNSGGQNPAIESGVSAAALSLHHDARA